MTTTILPTASVFERTFEQCCQQYSQLQMAVAWVGDPAATLPYVYLENLKRIDGVVGVAFCQSHPDGIQWLAGRYKLRIAYDKPLFHPKIYLFSKGRRRAALLGSSNLTFHGFVKNTELNVLLEGDQNDEVFVQLTQSLATWRTRHHSFVPDGRWIGQYRRKYASRRQKLRNAGVDDEVSDDNAVASTSAWLASASWPTYLRKVRSGLAVSQEGVRALLTRRLDFFRRVQEDLPIPWQSDYFNSIENRRLIGGMGPYGWLGHVAASGGFRHLLKNGTPRQHQVIATTINAIVVLPQPIPWNDLRRLLQQLIRLGPTMKVWSRVLAIVQPALYCTISSTSVQRNLSALLSVPQSSFETVEGYIRLLQLIHESPWFRSSAPENRLENQIWQKRTAFIDVVFHEDRTRPVRRRLAG